MTRRFALSAIVATASMLATMMPTLSVAAAPPTGAITCSIASVIPTKPKPAGILFHPFLDGTPRMVRIVATNGGSSCDASGVIGGKAPITGVVFKLTARFPDGTCGALASPVVALEKARVHFKWRGLNPANHLMTVATAKARIQSASYDAASDTLSFVTTPATGHSFVGDQFTIRLGIEQFADAIEAGCVPGPGGFLGLSFGNQTSATISNQ